MINRKAVYVSGALGTLYDQSRDQMLETLNVTCHRKKIRRPKTAACQLIRGLTPKSENLLEMIGIQDDLRMSILLNLVPRTELTSLIDYPHPITESTRFLHYTYIRRQDHIRDIRNKLKKQIKSSVNQGNATHIINSVRQGIEFVAVLQLPINETTQEIDKLLETVSSNLSSRKPDALLLTPSQERFLEQITDTKVYSNIPALASRKTIRDIYRNIYQSERNKTDHRPIDFELAPIQNPHVQKDRNDNRLNSLSEKYKREIEQRLIQLSNSINYFKSLSNENVADSLREHQKQQLDEVYLQWNDVQKEYTDEIKQLANLIVGFRKGLIQTSQIEEALEQQRSLQMKIDELTVNLKHLETEGSSNNLSERKRSPSSNAAKRDIDSTDNAKKIGQTLPKDDHSHTTSSPPTMEPQTADEMITILLLGESGVGKSTFINAFVNYLTFKTLREAESNKPVVLIPVSFLITAGDNFDEHIVKFGDSDQTNNEDFDHPGQSVTQRCKSYVFDLKHTNGKKLRIIDTPGFGDTRGLDQDDLNMQHILEYINNLTHLNAVCFLLKPNASRLNNFFRTCLIALFNLLSPDVRKNIIFCFTNARTTFFTPGDTAPLLRSLLGSMPMKDIPFKKVNTFCFDNESFRYLVALQNAIKFTEVDRNEYERSWSTSVKESNHLRDYICKDLPVYYMYKQWKSPKHAEIEIIHMIRPILEAMRNTLRNIILWDNDEKKNSIVLCASAINYPTTCCLSCDRRSIQLDRLSVINDCPHECLNKCLTCQCGLNKHMPIDYILQYKIIKNPTNYHKNGMTDQLSLLINACVEFTHFLKSTAHSWKDDPVLIGFRQMINDEKQICSDKKLLNHLNGQLLEELKTLKNKYERRVSEIQPNPKPIELAVIYERIQATRNFPGVYEQMDAIEKGQDNLMKYYEHEVSTHSTTTPDFISTAL